MEDLAGRNEEHYPIKMPGLLMEGAGRYCQATVKVVALAFANCVRTLDKYCYHVFAIPSGKEWAQRESRRYTLCRTCI